MAERRPPDARLVYSTGGSHGSTAPAKGCARCGDNPCQCEPPRSLLPGEQDVRVGRERGGRGGKTVTVAGPLC